MSQSKYKDVGKKQIINVMNTIIHKQQAIEMTLNLFIKMMDKKEEFNDFMTKELGGADEVQEDGGTNPEGDTPESTKD
jgi:hypothetical protein